MVGTQIAKINHLHVRKHGINEIA